MCILFRIHLFTSIFFLWVLRSRARPLLGCASSSSVLLSESLLSIATASAAAAAVAADACIRCSDPAESVIERACVCVALFY